MKVSHIIGSVLDTVFKIALLVLIVSYTYKYALEAYDFGYRVFAEEAVSTPETAKVISIYIPDGATAMEIGEALEEKGLIKDARLFFVQELLSGHHGELREGTYELSSAMKPEEMIKILTAKPSEDGEASAEEDDTATQDDGNGKESESGDGAGEPETSGEESGEEGNGGDAQPEGGTEGGQE